MGSTETCRFGKSTQQRHGPKQGLCECQLLLSRVFISIFSLAHVEQIVLSVAGIFLFQNLSHKGIQILLLGWTVCMERGVSRDASAFRAQIKKDLGQSGWESLHLWEDPMSDFQFREVFLRLGKPLKTVTLMLFWNPPCFWKARIFSLHHLCRHGAKKSAKESGVLTHLQLLFNSRLRNHGPNVQQAGRWTMEWIQDKLKWLLPLGWPVHVAKWFSPQL